MAASQASPFANPATRVLLLRDQLNELRKVRKPMAELPARRSGSHAESTITNENQTALYTINILEGSGDIIHMVALLMLLLLVLIASSSYSAKASFPNNSPVFAEPGQGLDLSARISDLEEALASVILTLQGRTGDDGWTNSFLESHPQLKIVKQVQKMEEENRRINEEIKAKINEEMRAKRYEEMP